MKNMTDPEKQSAQEKNFFTYYTIYIYCTVGLSILVINISADLAGAPCWPGWLALWRSCVAWAPDQQQQHVSSVTQQPPAQPQQQHISSVTQQPPAQQQPVSSVTQQPPAQQQPVRSVTQQPSAQQQQHA